MRAQLYCLHSDLDHETACASAHAQLGGSGEVATGLQALVFGSPGFRHLSSIEYPPASGNTMALSVSCSVCSSVAGREGTSEGPRPPLRQSIADWSVRANNRH